MILSKGNVEETGFYQKTLISPQKSPCFIIKLRIYYKKGKMGYYSG